MRVFALAALCAVLVFPAYSQDLTIVPASGRNTWNYFYKVVDTTGGVPYVSSEVKNLTISDSTTDTLQVIFTPHVKSILFSCAVNETSTVLIDYAVSLDGYNYSAFAVKDSLSHEADGYGTKSVDFTSTVLGFPFVKFRVRGSALAFAFGTSSTPKFWASYTLKAF